MRLRWLHCTKLVTFQFMEPFKQDKKNPTKVLFLSEIQSHSDLPEGAWLYAHAART